MEYIKQYWHILAGVVCVAVLGGVYFWQSRDTGAVVIHDRSPLTASYVYAAEPEQEPTPPIVAQDIVVHIEGAVYSPGVFTLPYGSRVNDALVLAGGGTEEADLARINLAAFLQDAQQIIIPVMGEEIVQIGQETTFDDLDRNHSGLLNINTADTAQLTTLPGIGPVIAGNIVNHRQVHGEFTSIHQLINVPNIGTTRLENIRHLVSID